MRFIMSFIVKTWKNVEWEKEVQKNSILTKWYDTIFQSLQASNTKEENTWENICMQYIDKESKKA